MTDSSTAEALVLHRPTTVRGRLLLAADAEEHRHAPLLVGFHGYGQRAEDALAALAGIDGAYARAAVQALHPFYLPRREGGQGRVGASWMTKEDRGLAVEDNIAWVDQAIGALRERGLSGPLVVSGFSQGVAMTYRAALLGAEKPAGALVLAGDVPPDFPQAELRRLPPVLLCRGLQDAWYTEEKMEADLQRLRAAEVEVTEHIFDGPHIWDPSVSVAAARWLRELGS
ncbi:MAG: phospholipase [Acidobacteriota bacterium]